MRYRTEEVQVGGKLSRAKSVPSEVLPDSSQHLRRERRCKRPKNGCDQVVEHAQDLARPAIIGRGFAHSVDEMNSGACRTLQ